MLTRFSLLRSLNRAYIKLGFNACSYAVLNHKNEPKNPPRSRAVFVIDSICGSYLNGPALAVNREFDHGTLNAGSQHLTIDSESKAFNTTLEYSIRMID